MACHNNLHRRLLCQNSSPIFKQSTPQRPKHERRIHAAQIRTPQSQRRNKRSATFQTILIKPSLESDASAPPADAEQHVHATDTYADVADATNINANVLNGTIESEDVTRDASTEIRDLKVETTKGVKI